MSFLEATGMGFLILMALIGICTCLYFMNEGRKSLKGMLDSGRMFEGAAVRDRLETDFLERRSR